MSNLSISKEEFFQLFPNKVAPRVWHLLTTKPKTMEEMLYKYLPSKIWRLNNLYTITDKHGEITTFKMNRAQFIVYAHVYQHWRLIILKSRQQGISTLWLISFIDDAIFHSNLNCGLMAQGKDEAKTLLERVKFAWDNLEPGVKSFIQRKLDKDNSSEFSFNNGSSLFIRTSFRSATLHRLHISELGKIANISPQKAKETKTGTLQTIAPGNIAVIESTAEGHNMYKKMWDASNKQFEAGTLAGKDFLPIFLSWVDDPDCVEFEPQMPSESQMDYFLLTEQRIGRKLTEEQKNFWIAQERELEGDIHQEYPATPEEAFAASKDGTYWSRRYLECVIRKGHKQSKLYDPNLDVYCVMDLGRNDLMVLTFFQYWEEGNGDKSIRIIGEYFNSGEGLEHYAQFLLNDITIDRGWNIKEVGLPHDGSVIDLSAKGRTRQDILADEGISNTTILAKQGKMDGIEAVRSAMPYIYIDSACEYLDSCFLYYTKEWNEVLENWKNEPKRNKYAHGADTIRYMVQYVETNLQGVRFKELDSMARQKEELREQLNGRSQGKSSSVAL